MRFVSDEQYQRMIATMGGFEEPTVPSCDRGHLHCRQEWGPTRSNCVKANADVYYQFNNNSLTDGTRDAFVDDEKLYWADTSAVILRYAWDGVLTW